MRLRFEIDRGDGPERIDVAPAALCAWEADHSRSVATLVDTIGISDMTELVYRQLVIDGRLSASVDLEAFRTSLVDIDPTAAPDPTSPRSGA